MKTTFIISLYLIYICFFSGCFSDKKSDEKIVIPQFEADLNDIKEIIHPVLLKEIDIFIQDSKQEHTFDSLNENKHLDSIPPSIFLIQFGEAKNHCYVQIVELLYVDSNYTTKYLKFGNSLLVFYNVDSKCNRGFINPSHLLNQIPQGFPDDNSLIADSYFEPLSREFLILSNDSLKRTN